MLPLDVTIDGLSLNGDKTLIPYESLGKPINVLPTLQNAQAWLYNAQRIDPQSQALLRSWFLPNDLKPGPQLLKVRYSGDANNPTVSFRFTLLPQNSPNNAPVKITEPIIVKNNDVLDGKGQTIDARGLERAFSVVGIKNATVMNYNIIADDACNGLVIADSFGCTIKNINFPQSALYGCKVQRSPNTTIDGITAGLLDAYLVYGEACPNLSISNAILATGSKNETGLRFMLDHSGLRIDKCHIINLVNPNKLTALRINGFGSDIKVTNSSFVGLVNLGPMGELDGGECETDPTKRALMLAYSIRGLVVDGCEITGGLGLFAGLSNCIISNTTINGIVSTQNVKGHPIYKVSLKYPDDAHYKAGDPIRRAPKGEFNKVVFTVPTGITTLGYTDNGPFDIVACTLPK